MTTFKKVENHGYTRRDILKMTPFKYFIKDTIISFVGLALTIVSITAVCVAAYKNEIFDVMLDMIKYGEWEDWYLLLFMVVIGALIIFSLISLFIYMPYFLFNVSRPLAILDLIFLDIYEMDTVILGCSTVFFKDEPMIEKNKFILDPKSCIRFTRGSLKKIDQDILDGGYTLDELRHKLVRVHLYCFKRTLKPIKYISFSLSDTNKIEVYRKIDNIISKIAGIEELGYLEELVMDTNTYIKKEDSDLKIKVKKIEKILKQEYDLVKGNIGKNPAPLLEMFKDAIPLIVNIKKYDINKNYISPDTLSDVEIAKIILNELNIIYEHSRGRLSVNRTRIHGRVEYCDIYKI